MKRVLFIIGFAALIFIVGCDGMEEKNDYLVSVKEDFTEEELKALDIADEDIKHKYSIMSMYLISLSESQVKELENHENVNYVEADKEVSTPEPGNDEK